ncbi:MAG TPA: ATP-binding cassette domain-containing protein [Anaerolineales bacterium]|nr:ATP-binding cassette domain-containing protein [Anaerolineales bacterium]
MISITDLTFTYPGANRPAIQGINLHIPDKELCLVMGPSGSGKSTLLRCLNGLVPHFSGGNIAGTIRVNGLDPVRLTPREMSQTVGFVFQDPEAQFVVDRVEDEIAFSLENAALPKEEMETRVDQALGLLELTHLRSRRLETLSGGEIQRVAIAAALALQPGILVLDEPTSQLDPHGAEEVLEALVQLNKQLSLTIILAEHRLERVLPYANRIIYLSPNTPGCITGTPHQVLSLVELNPPMVALGKRLGWQPLPLTVEEARQYTQSHPFALPVGHGNTNPRRLQGDETERPAFIQATGVEVSFGSIQALRSVDLRLYPGEITVLMGPNGAGKSTLLRTLIGLTPVQKGIIQVAGKDITGRAVAEICQNVGYLPQDPNALLFADTVMDELLITLRNHQMAVGGSGVPPIHLLDQLGLSDKVDSYPRDLSTGERQRIALGAILVTHPGALLLDEPTRGLDYRSKQTLLELLRGWRDEGMTILLVTHDVELAAQAADRAILMEKGQISADGEPKDVLANSSTFAPQVSRVFPGRGWLTIEDVAGAVSGR